MTLIQLRLLCVAGTFAASGLMGYLAPQQRFAEIPPTARADLAALDRPDGADVRRYVELLADTGLFPAAVPALLPGAGAARSVNDRPSISQDPGVVPPEAEPDAPAIRALVRREAEWRLYASQGSSLTEVFEVNETLFGGWTIIEISGRTLKLQRENETRLVNALDPGEALDNL